MDAESYDRDPRPEHADGGTRREFVQGAAVAGGALSLSAFLASCGGGSNDSSKSTSNKTSGQQGKASKGGNFRLGVQGGGSAETLNPTAGVAPIDLCRAVLCYEPLVKLNGDGKVVNVLAEEVAPTDKKFTKWTIKLKSGVTFHDGSPLTADDVIWSFQSSVLARPWAAFSAGAFSNIDPKSFKKVSDTELTLELTAPNALFVAQLSEPYDVVYQKGVKKFDKPIGTGPWKFDSWTQGERAKYLKWADWWGDEVNFDSIETVSIGDPSARLNALIGGEVDAIDAPSVPQIPQIKANKDLAFIENPGGLCNVIAMSCDPAKSFVKPAGGKSAILNNQVRQALRYLVPRKQIVDSVFGGHARIGNDLHSWFDPDYDSGLEQRPYDPEKAKSMLKAAGVDLSDSYFVYSDINPGVKDMCTLFASACEQSGAKLPTKVVPQSSYWSGFWPNKYPISVDYWRGRALANMWRSAYIKGAPFNETNFLNPKFGQVYDELTATGDPAKQKDLFMQGQKIAYDEGGYIIPAFSNMLQATSSKVVNIKTGIVSAYDNWDFTTAGFKAS